MQINTDRQKLLWLIMRHSGGGFVFKNTDGANIKLPDNTASALIGWDFSGNNLPGHIRNRYNYYSLSGKNIDNNTDVVDTSINFRDENNNLPNELRNLNLGDANANPEGQLQYINWLLSKIDTSWMDNDPETKQHLRHLGFLSQRGKLTINPNPVTANNIDDKLKRLFLALPDLQYVHREKMLNDPRLKREVNKKRANCTSYGTPHDFTDNGEHKLDDEGFNINQIVNKKINNSIFYGRTANRGSIDRFFQKSKKPGEPDLRLKRGNDNPFTTGLAGIIIHNGRIKTTATNNNYTDYVYSTNKISDKLDSTKGDYEMQIKHRAGGGWQNYTDNQKSNFTKDFRDWMLETFADVLKTKTEDQKTEFYSRLNRKINDPANATPPKPQALPNKENINYILQALDERLVLTSSVADNFNNNIEEGKRYIENIAKPIIQRAKLFVSSDKIQSTITTPESERLHSLFKLYTQNLGSKEANNRQELDNFFGKHLSKDQDGLIYDSQNNPNGIIESYKVFQRGANKKSLVEIIDRKRGCVPEKARPSVIKTTIYCRTPVRNSNYDQNGGAGPNDHNHSTHHHHTLTIDRYHKKHGNHKKNEYDIHLTDIQGNRVQPTTNNLKLGHFLDIARIISAKHQKIDLRKLPNTIVNIQIPDEANIRPIPTKWVMYGTLRALNIPENRIIILPNSVVEDLQQPTPNTDTAKHVKALINAIQGDDPQNNIIPIMNIRNQRPK